MPTTDLQQALAAYQRGELEAATRHLHRVLARSPEHADARMLAGLVANRRGEPEAAIEHFDRAVRADPEHDAAWSNRAAPLAQLERYDEAEQSLRRALALRLTPQAAAMLLRVLSARGEAARAAEEGRSLLARIPDHPLLSVLTGQALVRAGHPQQAMGPLSIALRQGRPEAAPLLARALRAMGRPTAALTLLDRAGAAADADLCNLRGLLHQDLGQSDAARTAFHEALRYDPRHGPAHHNLATSWFRAGEPERALPHHRQALAADPEDHDRWVALVDTLGRCAEIPADLAPLLLGALHRPGLAVQGLERALRHDAERMPGVASWLDGGPSAAVVPVLDTPLVRAWWTRTRVQGPRWERALTRLRRDALLEDRLDAHPELAIALAAQAWHTEFAWVHGPDELAALPGASPVLAAMYRSCDPSSAPLPAQLQRLHIEEPRRETELGAGLPALAPIDEPTSTAVRAQYEENPYPRLLSVHRKTPLPLPKLVRTLLPHLVDVPDPRPLKVLIAGCGTGQQALGASRYAHAQITAVDLSRASLGVAARQVEDWGLGEQIVLAQADLLTLTPDVLTAAGLPAAFHVIECGGVLHHLADPVAGWRRLIALLAPGGLMKIALYSEAARQDVIAASALVADLPLDADGLRASRARLLDLPEGHPARPVLWSVDFPSLSGFRDLVRHACEHRFTLPQLSGVLDELGLEFLGFQHPDPRSAVRYAARFPEDSEQLDLARWHIVETAHPECFVGMYQFWCRKRA